MGRIRPWLYIGKYRDTLNPNLLAANRKMSPLNSY